MSIEIEYLAFCQLKLHVFTSGNSSMDSDLTDDGDKRNFNLVSMVAGRKRVSSNRSKLKSSSKYLSN